MMNVSPHFGIRVKFKALNPCFFHDLCMSVCVYVQRKGVSSTSYISHSCYPMVNICKFVSLVPILFGSTPVGDAGTLTNRAAVLINLPELLRLQFRRSF